MTKSLVFFLLGGASYLAGRSYDRQADKLASVPRIREFKDLEPLLKSQNRLMVALRGNVGSETPMNCEFSELQGVVVEKTVLKYFLERIKNEDKDEKEDEKKNKDKGDEWRKDYDVLHSTSKQVPWYLDDGTFRVNVVGARSAEGFYCTHRYAVFEPSKSWHGVETLDDLENLPYITKGKEDRQVLGVKRIERVLPIGTSLSVIGEAVKDGNGTIRIQRPDGGGPFYVSPRTIDQLTEGQRGDARVFYGGSVVLTLLGVADIGLHFL
ncbi:E3 ubiquitin-protein ligase SP1-like [Prunus dulcis]|uniref:E3 ubiquitin-protein ligase SP1-like n=1 Tax=Prunus dulcis TaxID=3755 RepID=UPI0014836EF1|nr:E3 ubiquitin-protein ligase SP1-like [Prunus dulcis]